jgi:hypothetical protein
MSGRSTVVDVDSAVPIASASDMAPHATTEVPTREIATAAAAAVVTLPTPPAHAGIDDGSDVVSKRDRERKRTKERERKEREITHVALSLSPSLPLIPYTRTPRITHGHVRYTRTSL